MEEPKPPQGPLSLYDTDPTSTSFRQLLVLELYLPSLHFEPAENRRPFIGSNFTGLRAKEIHIFVASAKEMTDLSVNAEAKAIVSDLVNRGVVSVKIRPDLVRAAVVRRGDREDALAVRLRTTYFASMATTYGEQGKRERLAFDACAQLARKLVGDEMRAELRKRITPLPRLEDAELEWLEKEEGRPARAAIELRAMRSLLGQEEA